MDKVNKDKKHAGKAMVRFASDVASPYTLRRPTGILSLDLELGGGFHAGGGSQITGVESSCKTLLTYMVAAQVQLNYGDDAAILILSNELNPDVGFARQAGFCMAYSDEKIADYNEIRQHHGYPPFTDEEIADLKMEVGSIVVENAPTGEAGLELMTEALQTRLFHLCVIESLGALLPKEVDEKDIGERSFGGSSPMLTQFQNKIYPLFVMPGKDNKVVETTLLGINQARANIDAGMYGPKTRPAAGAYAWKHGQLISLELKSGSKLKSDTVVIGKEIRWETLKGKAGTHDGKKGTFRFYHLDRSEPIFWSDVQNADEIIGVDVVTDAIEVAKKMGVIDVSGSWFTLKMGRKTIRTQGVENMATRLMDEPELLKELRHECVKLSGIMVRYT